MIDEVIRTTGAMTEEKMSLQELRRDAALRSGWNIGFFAAGFFYWVFVTVLVRQWPLEPVRLYMIAGTFLIFPLAVIVSKILRIDPFGKGNPLTELVGYTHMSLIAMTFPVLIAVAVFFPDALVLCLAVFFCLDFYVMSWAFGTPVFGLHAGIRVAAASAIWFAFPDQRLTLIPPLIAVFYLVTIIALPIARRRWLERA